MKLLTTLILSIAFAGSTVTSASADNEDLAKAIVGIAAVAIIAKVLDDRKDRRREATATVGASRLGFVERSRDDHGRQGVRNTIRPFDRHGPKAGRGYTKTPLPRSCLRVVETGRRDRLAYGGRCLNRNFRFVSKLPDRCETAVRTNRGFRTVYGARCLERDGWKVARR